MTSRTSRTARRAFSMVELLIALTVSALLMTACLVALDRSFKSYEATTESASTHVVSRLVMHRVLAMIRQGEEFGPYPVGVLVPTKIDSTSVEFVSLDDPNTGQRQVTRLERQPVSAGATIYQLQFTRTDYVNGTQTAQFSYPLIRNLRDAKFTLEYDIGPVLRRATVDLTIQPDDASTNVTAIGTSLPGQVLRLIASTTPRRLN